MPQIQLEGVTKYYKGGGRGKRFLSIKDVDLTIEQGDFLFIVGSSGAGKTTLLRMICGDLLPTHGAVFLDDINVTRLSRWRHGHLRRYFGYVSQFPNLTRKKTIRENLTVAAIPRLIGPAVGERIQESLKMVGLLDAADKYPAQLTAAESRWVELACALINRPPILVLDELTDHLDGDTIWDMMQLLNEFNRQGGTVILATHAKEFVNIFRKRVITLVDGRIWGDVPQGRYGDIS